MTKAEEYRKAAANRKRTASKNGKRTESYGYMPGMSKATYDVSKKSLKKKR